MFIIIEVILQTVSGYSYTYERGKAGVKLLTHIRTKAAFEADLTPEFRTENLSSPTNVSKSVTNAS